MLRNLHSESKRSMQRRRPQEYLKHRCLRFESLDSRLLLAGNTFEWDGGAGDWHDKNKWIPATTFPDDLDDALFADNGSAPFLSPHPDPMIQIPEIRNFHVDTGKKTGQVY